MIYDANIDRKIKTFDSKPPSNFFFTPATVNQTEKPGDIIIEDFVKNMINFNVIVLRHKSSH